MSVTGVNHNMNTKFNKLQKLLKDMRRVMIAYSGGVDSTLLLKAAKDVLNENVLAITRYRQPLRK